MNRIEVYPPTPPLSVLCAAAPADQTLLAHWETTLLPLIEHAHVISCWSECHVDAGADVEQERMRHLNQADIIVLLLSPDFFASQMCFDVMHQALKRLHDKTAQVIPLLLRPVHWQATKLETLTPLPANGIPVTQWENEDAAWQSCVLGLQPILRRRLFATLPAFPSARAQRRAATDRERILGRLQKTYQDLLDQSLQGIAWMELGLASKPDAVRTTSSLLMRLPEQSEQMLPVGTRVLHAYAQAQEELLILGAPGAGKSTLLLDLALHLVEHATADDTHPLPLSTEATQQPPLAEWMIEQFARTYDVPRLLSTRWVQHEQVLPLLDGLDEMEETARSTCITAINRYHREHLTPLVVCSRQHEYDTTATKKRLALQSAVIVQPLTHEQIEASLQAAGPAFVSLRTILSKQPALRELATTPLMLSVLMLTYHNTPIDDLPRQQDELEEQIWTNYVERMVHTKGADHPSRAELPEKRYPLAQTRASLSWLALHMRIHNQTLFYGEYLQENWLPAAQQRAARWLLVRLPAMLLGGLTNLLLALFIVTTPDRTILCQAGLVGSVLGWCLSQEKSRGPVAVPLPKRWQEHIHQRYLPRLSAVILLSFLSTASLGLDLTYDHVNKWLLAGIITGVTIGISAWLFQGRFAHMMLSDHLPPRPTSGRPNRFGWMQMMPGRRAIWAGVLFGIGTRLSYGLREGLDSGLSAGGTALLASLILGTQKETILLAERVHWSGHTFVQWHHLRTSLLIALVCTCIFGFIEGLDYVPILALSSGLSFGLSYWLLMGLYQGIIQEHLPDQDRRQFNQGLHRSLRNGALLSLLEWYFGQRLSV